MSIGLIVKLSKNEKDYLTIAQSPIGINPLHTFNYITISCLVL